MYIKCNIQCNIQSIIWVLILWFSIFIDNLCVNSSDAHKNILNILLYGYSTGHKVMMNILNTYRRDRLSVIIHVFHRQFIIWGQFPPSHCNADNFYCTPKLFCVFNITFNWIHFYFMQIPNKESLFYGQYSVKMWLCLVYFNVFSTAPNQFFAYTRLACALNTLFFMQKKSLLTPSHKDICCYLLEFKYFFALFLSLSLSFWVQLITGQHWLTGHSFHVFPVHLTLVTFHCHLLRLFSFIFWIKIFPFNENICRDSRVKIGIKGFLSFSIDYCRDSRVTYWPTICL